MRIPNSTLDTGELEECDGQTWRSYSTIFQWTPCHRAVSDSMGEPTLAAA
jgi:hypothetical protein